MNMRAILVVSVLLALGASGCASAEPTPTEPAGAGFAIYLPLEDLPIDDVGDLTQVALADIPVLSMDDILTYDWATHTIELEPTTAELLDALELPGRPFVVTVNQTPIYAGAFMAAFFSRSYDGVVILWPPIDGSRDTLTIQLGYPGEDFFTGTDPRSDERIREALLQAGRLQ